MPITIKQSWTKAKGDDLPATVNVYLITGGLRRYRWVCQTCERARQVVSKAGAFEDAWDHVTGDLACEAEDPKS